MFHSDNQYTQQQYENKMKVVSDLNSYGGYVFTAEAPDSEGRFDIKLAGDVPIQANYWDYRKDYVFFLNYRLPYVTRDVEADITKKMVEAGSIKTPQNVHKLNARKIDEWVKYLTLIYKQLVIVSAEKKEEVDNFLSQVRALGAKFDKTPDWNLDLISGSILKNGIEFTFQVHDSGYISKKIEVHYKVRDTIEAFTSLADNRYTAESL